MGANFGHFSVFDSSIQEAQETLKSLSSGDNCPLKFDKAMQRAHPNIKPGTEEAIKLVNKLYKAGNPYGSTYYIGTNGKWVTIFNEWFGWGSVEPVAIKYSKNSMKLCFAISLFDSDVFSLAVIKEGYVLTRHICGDKEAYGVESSLGNIDILADTFGINEAKEQLQKILEKDDQEDKISDLERLFDLKLWGINQKELKSMGGKKVTV